MAGSRTGTPTVIWLTRKICKTVTRLGASDLAAKTNAEYAAAVNALVAVCMAFEALDDQPAEIDNTGAAGVEDV
jgi:hypothetical protein